MVTIYLEPGTLEDLKVPASRKSGECGLSSPKLIQIRILHFSANTLTKIERENFTETVAMAL